MFSLDAFPVADITNSMLYVPLVTIPLHRSFQSENFDPILSFLLDTHDGGPKMLHIFVAEI